MAKGEKEYLKHLLVLFLLVGAIMFLAYSHSLDSWMLQVLVVIAFSYIALFFIGLVFNIGPFKYISRLYAEDAERKKESLRSPKQPWE